MPKDDMSRTKLTRRGFVKGTGLAAGAAAVGFGGAAGYEAWLKPAKAHAQADEHVAYTYHQQHCGGTCPLECKVRDGRLVQVQPNEAGGDRYATICLKGLSEVQHIYGKGRIQTPLKRVGERGANEFVAISWDEALDMMVDTITDLQNQHGKDCVLVKSTSETLSQFMAPMFGAQVGGNGGIDNGLGNGLDPAIGHGGGYAGATAEARDWANSKLVLTVGSNFIESSLPQARLFFEAKEAGARMVTVDPHFSPTAGKSDQWIPIVPGTDAALFLGMVTAILDNKWYDEDFILQHTAFPYLVDTKTHKLLRDHAENPSAEKPETGETNPFFVWDQVTSQKRPYADPSATPALKGSFMVDGLACTTVFSLLEETQKQYTLDWASEKTHIPVDTIKALAQEYACGGPASLALGFGGGDKMTNADIAGHAAALLTALTGNVGKPGTGVGVYVGGLWNGYAATLGSWKLPDHLVAAASPVASYDLKYQDNNVRAFICMGDTIQQKNGNMNKTVEWVKQLDFVVTIDVYFTEGAKWSDLVLPVCSRFENDEEIGSIISGYNHLVIQSKVIDPLFEAKTEFWLEREIAKRLGFEEYLPKTARELVERKLSSSKDPYIAALTVDDIVKNGYMYPLEGIEEPRAPYGDFVFSTTSGRLDVYYEDLIDFGQALPTYEDCYEAYADNPLREKYPLQFSNVRSRFRIHNQFADARWVQQFYEPYVELNPTDMAARGLATGDTVEVLNDRGSFKCKVKSNEAVRPDSARMCEAATSDYLVEGNMQNVTNDTMIERGYALMAGPVIPFSDTLVEIKKA